MARQCESSMVAVVVDWSMRFCCESTYFNCDHVTTNFSSPFIILIWHFQWVIKDILPAKSLTNYWAMQRLIGLFSTVQYSTVRSWFDCFDGLPFGLVYHLGVWKISSCFATLFIAHQFWRNKVYKEIILELNDPIGRTMVQCFVTSNSPKTYSSFLSNQNDTWNIECNQVNRKTTWKHIWTIFCFDIKISRQIDIRVCQKASWCIRAHFALYSFYAFILFYWRWNDVWANLSFHLSACLLSNDQQRECFDKIF